MRSELFGVAVRQLGVAANGAGHVSLFGVAGCLVEAAPAASLHANTARATGATQATVHPFALAVHIGPFLSRNQRAAPARP
jgi:hypothetical protein